MNTNIYHTADRTITLTCAENGDILAIELRGNLSPARLSAELSRLHSKALPQYQQPYSHRDMEKVMAQLSEPPMPALSPIYGALHDSMATLRKAGEDLRSHSSEGSNEAVTVRLSGSGHITEVHCKEKAKTLAAEALAQYIVDAYRQAKAAAQSYSDERSTELAAALRKINPIHVTGA